MQLLNKGMNKVNRLPGLVLASLLVTSPSLATATQIPSQKMDSQSDPVMLAQFRLPRLPIPRTINDVINTGLREFQRMQQRQRREEERQLREVNRIRQQEEREARAREAARQRQAYFESLTPEQQQAYIEEQRRRQQAMADLIAGFFLGAIMPNSSGGSSSQVGSQPAHSSEPQVIHQDDRPRRCLSQDGDPCNSFTVVSSGNLLFFAYYFNGAPLSFIAHAAEPIQQTDSVTAYLVSHIVVIDDKRERLGQCVVGRVGNQQYHTVLCSTQDGLQFEYTADS